MFSFYRLICTSGAHGVLVFAGRQLIGDVVDVFTPKRLDEARTGSQGIPNA